jgi:DNA-directed RNA polymerase subunit E'/Rpb7
MFYILDVEDHVRVEPKHFGLPTHESIEKQLNESYVNRVNKELGFVINVISVDFVDEKGRLKLSIKDADPNFVQKK